MWDLEVRFSDKDEDNDKNNDSNENNNNNNKNNNIKNNIKNNNNDIKNNNNDINRIPVWRVIKFDASLSNSGTGSFWQIRGQVLQLQTLRLLR